MMNGKRKNAPNLDAQSTAPHDEMIVLVGSQAWNAYGTKKAKNSGKSEEWLLLAQALEIKPSEKPVILGGAQLDDINGLNLAPEDKKIARLCQFGELTDAQLGGIVANFARYSDVDTLTLCDNLGQMKDNLTDWLNRTREDEENQALLAKAAETDNRQRTEPYVEMRDEYGLKGLFQIKPKFDSDTHTQISEKVSWICDPLDMAGVGKNEEGDYFYIFKWKNIDEKEPRLEAISCGDFGTETAWRALKNKGLKMTPKTGLAQALVEHFHAQSASTPKWSVTSATGWHAGAYLLPSGEIIGTPNKQIIFKNKSANAAGYRTAGTLESWQREIANYVRNNPSMMMGIAVALAAPLVRLIGADSFGVHLFNSSSKGKTTTLNIANSIYGDPDLIKSSWNTTGTAINNEAEARNDGLITLDEMGQSKKPYEVENIAYSLFNETGRLRGQKEGGNVDLSRWKICALSTGEKDLESFLLSKGIAVNAGQLVRLLNIPLIEAQDLHGFNSNKEHADHLNDAVKANFGVIGREWIKFLSEHKEHAKAEYDRFRAVWLARLPEGASGQVQRVSSRFAVLETALHLASHLTQWTEEENREALIRSFNDWLADFGTGEREEAKIVEFIIDWLAENAEGVFIPIPRGENDRPLNKIFGYRILEVKGMNKEHFYCESL